LNTPKNPDMLEFYANDYTKSKKSYKMLFTNHLK
jgi:hypothetical protein